MDYFVGNVPVSAQFARFYLDGEQPRSGLSPDGNFSDEEVTLFARDTEDGGRGPRNPNNMSVLTFVRGELAQANPADAELSARFEAYRSYILSNCESVTLGQPVAVALYEELTAYIEGPRFSRATPVMQERIIGLQADLFSRVTQEGRHRGVAPRSEGRGTAAEVVQSNPVSEPFEPSQPALENVLQLSQYQQVELGVCSYHSRFENSNDTVDFDAFNIYPHGAEEPQPFSSGRAVSVSRAYILDAMPELDSLPEPQIAAWIDTFFTTDRNNPDRLRVRPEIERIADEARTVARSRIIDIFGEEDPSWQQFFIDPNQERLTFRPNSEGAIRRVITNPNQQRELLGLLVISRSMTRENGDSNVDYFLERLASPVNMDVRWPRDGRPVEESRAHPPAPAAEAAEEPALFNSDDDDPLGGLGDF